MPKSTKTNLFIALLAVFLVKEIFWVALIPPPQAPDEYAHLSYIETWAHEGRLPKLGETLIYKRIEESSQGLSLAKTANKYEPGEQLNWIAQHPPLYYFLLKQLYSSVENNEPDQVIFFLRFTSIFFGLLTLFFVYLMVETLKPKNEWLSLLVVGFIAFLPDFSFISAVLNNDNLVMCLSADLLYLGAKIITHYEKISRKFWVDGLYMSIVMGLLLITKATSLPIVAATIPFEMFYFGFKKHLPMMDFLKLFLMQFITIFGIAGWWYIGNYMQFHQLLPDLVSLAQNNPQILKVHPDLITLFPEVTGMKNLLSPYQFFVKQNFFWKYFVNIWGVFGKDFVQLSIVQIMAYAGLIFASIIGYIKTRKQQKIATPINIFFAFIAVILFAAITFKLFQIAQGRGFLGAMHGRYFLPAMIPIGYWIISGIQRLVKNRQNYWLVALLFLFFAVTEIATIATVIIPSFY